MVDENKQGDAEIDWLNAEIEGLQSHKPDALAELGVEVTFLPIFCCCDGKTINAQLKVEKSQNLFSILPHTQKTRIKLLLFRLTELFLRQNEESGHKLQVLFLYFLELHITKDQT